jgi:4-amino-4-deoxy-L-arabinose transferase-like glycosyltransferase
LPPFGWHSIRDMTHTVLVTAMMAGAWWLLLRIARRGGAGCQREFAVLGLVCGCGMLAKYNFALMLAVFVAALLSVQGTRRALFGRGWWWTVLVGVVVVAPHGVWLLSNWHSATAGTARLIVADTPRVWGAGLGALLVALLDALALWVIVALAAFGARWWRRPVPMPEPATPWLRPVFMRYAALSLIALLALAAGMDAFKSRWMLPLLIPVPLLAFALRPELEADPRGHRMTGLTLMVALLILMAAAAQPWFAYVDGRPHPPNYPAVQLAQALQSAGYDGRSRIIAADHLLAGTLRTRFPAAPVAACPPTTGDVAGCVAGNAQMAEHRGQGWLVISHENRLEPGWWEQALTRLPDSASLPRNHLHIPYRSVRPSQPLASYDFVWQPAASPPP